MASDQSGITGQAADLPTGGSERTSGSAPIGRPELADLFGQAGQEGPDLDGVLAHVGRELLHYAKVVTGSEAAADDAVQELLVALVRMGERARGIKDPRAWLFKVLRRCAHRQRRLRPAGEDFPQRLCATVEGDPAQRLLLEEACARLNPEEQETLLLHCWQGLTFDELAKVLDVPRGTVLSRYRRALQELKAWFGVPEPEKGSQNEASRTVSC